MARTRTLFALTSLALAWFVPSGFAAAAQVGEAEALYQLVEIDLPPGRAAAEVLAELGLESQGTTEAGAVQVVTRTEDLARLSAQGLTHRVRVPDLEAFYAQRLAADLDARSEAGFAEGGLGQWLTPPVSEGAMGGYYTFAEVVSVMQQIEAAFPSIVRMSSLGTSIEGRELWALRITDHPDQDEGEPLARVDALHHAREPIGMQVALWFALYLTENYGTDPLATYLVDEREIWVVPVMNPDGYVHNETTSPNGGGLWRKNRRHNSGGSIGVDLNRNYSFHWGYDNTGSSPGQASETYRGSGPASEPEVAAMEAFMSTHVAGTSLTLHTYGHLWLTPLSHIAVLAANQDQYLEVGGLATAENGYALGTSWQLLEVVNGSAKDHDHGVHGAISCTPELGTDGDGFWPPSSRIVPLCEQNLTALARTVRSAGAYVHPLEVTQVDEGDGDGWPEPGEDFAFALTLRNSGRSAPATPVVARLVSNSPFATVTSASHTFGAVGPFSSETDGGMPLRLSIAPNAPLGTAVTYTLELEAEGFVETWPGTLDLGARVPLIEDGVEQAFGWTVGAPGDHAVSGQWVLADPTGNTAEGEQQSPDDDATPAPGTLCYITGNGQIASVNDVDGGPTTLLSPPFDLEHVGTAYIGYSRWYANFGDNQEDDLFVEITNDGGQTWVPLETVVVSRNEWTPVRFRVADFVAPTDAMQLRFRIADEPNNSVTDAAVDEFQVDVVYELPRFTVFGRGQVGKLFSLNVTGEAGDGFFHTIAFGTADIPLPGVQGEHYLLDPLTSFPLVSGAIPAARHAVYVNNVPNDTSLSGGTAYFQSLVFGPAGVFLTNRGRLDIE